MTDTDTDKADTEAAPAADAAATTDAKDDTPRRKFRQVTDAEVAEA